MRGWPSRSKRSRSKMGAGAFMPSRLIDTVRLLVYITCVPLLGYHGVGVGADDCNNDVDERIHSSCNLTLCMVNSVDQR